MATNFEWQAMFVKYIVGAMQVLVNAEACPLPPLIHTSAALCVLLA